MDSKSFGEYLRSLRKEKKLTIRQLDLYSGVSHSYLSQLERGKRGVPSPDILKKLYKPLGVSFEELMIKAGHIEEAKKDDEFLLPESEYERIITETEKHYGVNLRDDPVVYESMKQLIVAIAKAKKENQK